MQLITDAQRKQLLKNGSPEQRDKDHPPVVKLFMPFSGCTWLLSELDPDEPNIAFGLCDLGMGFPELGSVCLNELQSVRHPLGLKVERDISFEGKHPMSVYASAARSCEQITEDDTILSRHVKRKPNAPLTE